MTADKSRKSSGMEKLFSFEKSLSKLEELAEQLEHGDLSIEDSLNAFEQGINLTRESQKALAKAEQKVQLLLKDGDKASLETLDNGGEGDE